MIIISENAWRWTRSSALSATHTQTHLQKTWLANTSCGWPWSSPPSSARWATWRGSWARCCRRWRSPGNPSQGSRWHRGQTWCSRNISESDQDEWTARKDDKVVLESRERRCISSLTPEIKQQILGSNKHPWPQSPFALLACRDWNIWGDACSLLSWSLSPAGISAAGAGLCWPVSSPVRCLTQSDEAESKSSSSRTCEQKEAGFSHTQLSFIWNVRSLTWAYSKLRPTLLSMTSLSYAVSQ